MSGNWQKFTDYTSQSPQTGQVYFNSNTLSSNWKIWSFLSQSPQTGQVYFNLGFDYGVIPIDKSLNPLKRVKFISIEIFCQLSYSLGVNVSIPSNGSSLFQ